MSFIIYTKDLPLPFYDMTHKEILVIFLMLFYHSVQIENFRKFSIIQLNVKAVKSKKQLNSWK